MHQQTAAWWRGRLAAQLGGRARMLATALIAVLSGCEGLTAAEQARDPVLRQASIAMYPARDRSRPPDAIVFFLGNDVGFWGPHRELAAALRYRHLAVAGVDITTILAALPDSDAQRGAAWTKAILPLIERSRRELGGTDTPVIIAGHSLGAELALWTASYARPAGVIGVLPLSPGSRSHLRVALSDLTMSDEPQGPGSFSVADAVRDLPADEAVAILRGQRDKFAVVDSTLLAAGGARARLFSVPFSGHSLYSLTLSYPVVSGALDWILEHPRAAVSLTTGAGRRYRDGRNRSPQR